jgi:tripartite-type tricarboxylate transporter receptor subunit TctC
MNKAVLSLLCTILSFPALAQDYPSRAVRLVVSFTPGGGADTTARVFGDRLSELWRQPVVIENRPGAGGSIGAEAVSKAPADGYTLLLAPNTHVINQVVYPQLTFDIREFTPIAMVTNAPMVIAVNASQIAAKDLKEFTAMLKSAPGKYSYTACNVASTPHFGMEMYKHAMGIDAVHVPHKGCGPAAADAAAGHIPIVVTVLPSAVAFFKQGKLRPIALIDAERSPSAPDIPTLRESGIPELKDVSLQSYYGFMGPPGMPTAVAQKIEADVLKIAALPEVRKRLEGAGTDLYVLDAKAMIALIRADYDKLSRAAKAANIKAE